MSLINLTTHLLLIFLARLVIAQLDPYGQRPYNQNTDRPSYGQYDRNNPYDRDRYDRPGQGLSDRERYDRFDRNRTDPYGQQNPYDRDRYGPGQYDNRDRYNSPYDRNRTYGYDRNRPDQYGPYGNRSDPYGQPYDRDHRYGQGGQYDRRGYPGQPGRGFAGQDDPNCCEDYCYDRDRDQYLKFGPVTAYQFVSGKHQLTQDVPQCKPMLFWSINKHGTNIPDQEILQGLRNVRSFREEVMRNYDEQTYPLRGRLCQEDYELINNWRLNESLIHFQGKELTPEGREELRLLARRFQNKYRDLLSVPYSESHYYFKYTNADRTYDSYQAYLEGLFNNNAFNVHAVIDTDDISKGYRSCYGGYSSSSSSSYDPYSQNTGYNDQRYSSSGSYNNPGSGGYSSSSGYSSGGYGSGSTYSPSSGYNPGSSGYNPGGYSGSGYSTGAGYSSGGYGANINPNRDYEYIQFKRNAEYTEMARHVLRRLGFINNLPNETAVVEDIYNMCRYEKAWRPNAPSAWCAAFNKKQLRVLEYAQDLREYFRHGYGNEDVSNRLGCGILKQMYRRLQRGVDGYTSDPKVVVNFASEGSILNLLVAMGVARDYTPLSAQNYYSQSQRKWRTADLSPFTANLVAVLYECDSTSRDMYKVMFYLNENPMDFPECSQGVCSWDTVRSKFEDVVNRCDYCNGSEKLQLSIPILLGTILVISSYKWYF